MKKIETHPSPEKLLRQVTEEAVNALALGGPDKIGDEAPMEAGPLLKYDPLFVWILTRGTGTLIGG